MLNKTSPKPLYEQLDEKVRSFIDKEEWEPNSPIPSENILSQTYNVSRTTVRKVLINLVNEGLLFRVQGKGTFVAEPKITAKSLAYMGVREQLERMGYKTTTKLISFKQVKADTRLNNIMDVKIGDELHFIERLRLIEGNPISLHRSYIPKVLAPTLTSERFEIEQLCVILQQEFDLKPTIVTETLESVQATKLESDLLDIERNYPLLMLEDINKTATGRVYEYTKVLFRGDKIKLNFEYREGVRKQV
ncbi:MAG: GntR family transcriptional regulator [Anaerolineaceae bacterium]